MEEDRNEMAHSTSCKHYGSHFGGPENGESRSQRARLQTIALDISFWGHHIPPEICLALGVNFESDRDPNGHPQ